MFPYYSEEFFHSWLLWNFKWSTNKVRNCNRTSKNIWKVDSVLIISPRPMISSCADSVQELELDKTVIFAYHSAKIIVFLLFCAPVKGFFWDLRFRKRLRYTCIFQERNLWTSKFLQAQNAKSMLKCRWYFM